MLKQLISTVTDAKEQFAAYGEWLIDMAADNETWEKVPLVEHAIRILSIKDVYKKNKLKRNYAAFVQAASSMNADEARCIYRGTEALGAQKLFCSAAPL